MGGPAAGGPGSAPATPLDVPVDAPAGPGPHTPLSAEDVEVRRSARRRRTVTAFRESGALVVCIPASFSRTEERDWVERMVVRLRAQEERRRPDDAALARRAEGLSARYLGGRARPTSVRWVANQHARWGSTSTAEGTIRLSDRLRGMPAWVVDYVLVHELAHLIEHGHGERFWSLVSAFPRAERARGYLEGVAAAGRGIGVPGGVVGDEDGAADGGEDDGEDGGAADAGGGVGEHADEGLSPPS